MEISTTVVNGVQILTIAGTMDGNKSNELAIACPEISEMPVVLDMIQIKYINSSALRGLLEFNRKLQVHGSHIVLVETATGFTNKILKLTGFDNIFPIYPSVPDAVRALTGKTGSAPETQK